jgi:hypothetical protein
MATSIELQSLSGLTQKDRITILLAEYSTLRAEIVSRISVAIQIAAATLLTITFILQQRLSEWRWPWWAALGVIALGTLTFAILNNRDLGRCARRIRQIEHEINSRAGEHLLVWEQIWGGARKGLAKLPLGTITVGDRSELPPLDPSYLERERSSGQPGRN